MEYALMFYEAPTDFAKRESADAQAYYGSWMAYIDAIDRRASGSPAAACSHR